MEYVFHGKKIIEQKEVEYFSVKQSNDVYNFKKNGICPDEDKKIVEINAFLEPSISLANADTCYQISKLQGLITLFIAEREVLKVPISIFKPKINLYYYEGNQIVGLANISFTPIPVDLVIPKDKTVLLKLEGIYPISEIDFYFGFVLKLQGGKYENYRNSSG
ncbi:MAG: hypothetical protein QXJ14_02785 [Candidatus Aenigmatarchaeota archaeon]